MKNQKAITLKLTEKELSMLQESVGFSVKDKHDKLMEACEGGYYDDSGDRMIRIDPSRYEEYFDYQNLAATLRNAELLPS